DGKRGGNLASHGETRVVQGAGMVVSRPCVAWRRMTPERYQQIDQLFRQALEKPATDRSAFIVKACAGDEELRTEVQSLLRFHDEPLIPLDDGPSPLVADLIGSDGESANTDPPPQHLPEGTAVDRYVIIRDIGGGGMGFVYLARDPELNRKVAIKLLRAG